MNKDTVVTEVIFRKDKSGDFKGEITAYFPYIIETHGGNIACYAHLGQHSSADYFGCVAKSVLATKDEYNDLYMELESLGYNLKVIKRCNHKRYSEAWRKSFKH